MYKCECGTLHRRERLEISRPRRPLTGAFIPALTLAVPCTTGGQEIFSDGFESGDTTRWSIQIPIPDPVDGTYQLAVYDSFAFASGGNLVIASGKVIAVNGTYFNFEKVDAGGAPQCAVFFLWGGGLDPTNVKDLGIGVSFRSAPAWHGVEALIRGPRWARMPRAVSDTAETGVWESASRHNALRTPAPRPTAASMTTLCTGGRGRDGVRRWWGGSPRPAGREGIAPPLSRDASGSRRPRRAR